MRTLSKLVLTLSAMALCSLRSQAQSFALTCDNLTKLYGGKSQWVDLDNDHDLDLVYNGFPDGANTFYTLVYENNAGTFVAKTTNLPNLRNGYFSFGDFDNDGDQDVVVSGIVNLSGPDVSDLYENTGGFNFTLRTSFPGLHNPGISWFDIDNDMDLDLFITGIDNVAPGPITPVAYVYENSGGTFNLLPSTNLPVCTQCELDWADANGDGRVDLIFTGFSTSAAPTTALYINNGNKTFHKDTQSTFRQFFNGEAKWGDMDNDGDMDLYVGGINQSDGTISSIIYQNNAGIFTERSDINIYSAGETYLSGVKWLDFDNDGYLDLLVTGRGTNVVTLDLGFRLFKNNGVGNFQLVSESSFVPMGSSSVDTGDFDNDGDIDICFSGTAQSGIITGIYKNLLRSSSFTANTNPGAPLVTDLSEKITWRDAILRWGLGSDGQTPPLGLTHNVYLKKAGANVVVPPSNFTNGYWMTANPVNGQGHRTAMIDPPEGDYAWAVQSIDGGKAGSPFSAERNFYFMRGPQASPAQILDVDNVKLTWSDRSQVETSYRVFRSLDARTGFVSVATPAQNSTTYTDNFTFATDTYYFYRIQAEDASHTSGYDSVEVLIPTSPSSLSAAAANASRINLTWQDLSLYETGYVVERKATSGSTFVVVQTLAAGTTSFIDNGLTDGTSYDYRVRAINVYGSSGFSNVSTAQTNFKPFGSDFSLAATEDVIVTFSPSDFTTRFSDPDVGDALAGIVITSLPSKGAVRLSQTTVAVGQMIPIASLGALEFAPTPNANGTTSFQYAMSDGKDNSTLAYTITLNIAAVNDPPDFTFPAVVSVDEDFGSRITTPTPIVIADEASQTITYSILPTTSDKVLIALDPVTGKVTFTSVANKNGSVNFVLTADDGQSQNNLVSKSFTLVINAVNDPPVIAFLANVDVELKAPIPPVTVSVTDVDNASVTVSAASSNSNLVKNEKITVTGSGLSYTINIVPENAIGSTVIIVKASDGALSTTASYTLNIFSTTAVTDTENMHAVVYPNPALSSLIVDLNDLHTGPSTLVIFDLLGREVSRQEMTQQAATIDVSNFASGVYIIKVSNNGNALHLGKFIKK